MDERHNELGAVLADLRRRWTRRTRLGAWAAGASAAAMVLAVGLLAVWLVAARAFHWPSWRLPLPRWRW